MNQREIKELFEEVAAVGHNYDIDVSTSLDEGQPEWIKVENAFHTGAERNTTSTWRVKHVGKFKNLDMLQMEWIADDGDVIGRHTVPADPLLVFALMYVD